MSKVATFALGCLVVFWFFVFATVSSPRSPAMAAIEYAVDPASALLDRQAEREHEQAMTALLIEQHESKMFWRSALLLVVLAVLVAVLGVLLSLRAVRVRREYGVRVLPAERHRLTG